MKTCPASSWQRRAALRRTLLAAALTGLAGAALARTAPTDDESGLTLEQLLDLDIESASKFVQKASEAPSAVTVVSASDIRRFGYRKLADILNSIRGVYIHYDRNYDYIGVRGFGPLGSYNSRVLVMVDGYRLNDPVYGQGSIGREFPVDVDLIDRVEFVPGPGSAIHGSNAFFGVINVITRNGKGIGGGEAAVEAASADTYKARTTYGRRYESGLEVLFSGAGYHADGRDIRFREFAASGDGIAHRRDGERTGDLFVKLGYDGFTLEAAHRRRDKDVPTASFGSRFDDEEHTRDEQSFIELRGERRLSPTLELAARVNQGSYRYRGDYPYDGDSRRIVNVDIARSSWWGGELKIVSRAIPAHKLVGGIEYQKNNRKEQLNFDLEPFFSYLDESHKSSQTGVYLQDEWSWRSDLAVNAGLRWDRYSTFGSIANPRLALIYIPAHALTLKALYGKAYRAPNDGELFFSSQPLGWKANTDLKPERITTNEVVGEWRMSALSRLTLSAFRYRITHLITLTTDPADKLATYENLGTARVSGVQAEYEQLWNGGAALRTSYSFQRGRDESGKPLVNSPRHLAKLDGSLPLAGESARAGLTLRYASRRLTRSGAAVGGASVADFTLSSDRLLHGGEISLSIYNLLDRRYSDPVSDAHPQDSIEQDRRSVRLKAVFRF